MPDRRGLHTFRIFFRPREWDRRARGTGAGMDALAIALAVQFALAAMLFGTVAIDHDRPRRAKRHPR